MKKVELIIPRHYGEMDEKQTHFAMELHARNFQPQKIRTRCFIKFANIRPVGHIGNVHFFTRPKWKSFFSMTSDEVAYFSRKMNWINTFFVGIKPPKIEKKTLCDALLRDTIYLQYLEAENFFQEFVHTKSQFSIFKFLAVLSQKSSEYDNSNIAKKAKYFEKKANETDITHTIFWYLGVKQYFSKKWDSLFVKIIPKQDDDKTPIDMLKITNGQIRLLTDGDISKRKEILMANTWDALDELNAKCNEVEELKKLYKK